MTEAEKIKELQKGIATINKSYKDLSFQNKELLGALKDLHDWVIRTHVGLNDLEVLKNATAIIQKTTQ